MVRGVVYSNAANTHACLQTFKAALAELFGRTIMKRLFLVFALTLFLGLAGTATAANPDGASAPNTINVLNKTNFDIYTLAVSPTNANQWESRTLAQKVLPNGDTADLMMAQTSTAKAWDLQVTDGKGNTVTWIGLPINPQGQITLLPDGAYLVSGKNAKTNTSSPAPEKANK